jgi:hypothetical protein
MKTTMVIAAMALPAGLLAAQAADINIHVLIPGEVRPGVYGRVDLGSAPPPPLVYAKPVIIVREPRPAPLQPIYLHVPPGHAKNWSKHCKKYDACGRPVYFVMSDEYKPKKAKKKDKD